MEDNYESSPEPPANQSKYSKDLLTSKDLSQLKRFEEPESAHDKDPSSNITSFMKKSDKNATIEMHRPNIMKQYTMGLSSSPAVSNYDKMLGELKTYKNNIDRVLKKFRSMDKEEYEKFVRLKVTSKKVKGAFNEHYLLSHGFGERALAFLLNSYDEVGLTRLFQAFYLEFDTNNDQRMEKKEMEECIEYLAKDNFIGKAKIIETLKEFGVNCENKLSFFLEGSAAKKVLNQEKCSELFEKLKWKEEEADDKGTVAKDENIKIAPADEIVDLIKITPLMMIFFLEYMVKVFLKKRSTFQMHLGFPYTIGSDGNQQIDYEGKPSGLYLSFVTQLKGETSITKEVLSYRIVSKALIAYRAAGFSDSISMEALERILKKVRSIMEVDPVSCNEKKLMSMDKVLPFLAARISTEATWASTTFRKSIEKYDHMVNWLGGALCMDLSKETIHSELRKAFSLCPNPTFDQFVKGLDFILKKLIPTFESPAAYFIAKKLRKTPNALAHDTLLDDSIDKVVKFNMDFIIKHDDILQRLFQYSINTKIKLLFVRQLYNKQYGNYKRKKKINKAIFNYNEIVLNTRLFSERPGEYGTFSEISNKAIKNDDAEEMKKEKAVRDEMKKKRFIESLFDKGDDAPKPRKKSIRQATSQRHDSKISEKTFAVPQEKKKLQMIMELQAKANEIDRKLNLKDLEQEKKNKRTIESSAYPNNKDITPAMLLSLLEFSQTDSKTMQGLKDFIYLNKDKASYQDTVKYLLEQDISKTPGESSALERYQTKYLINDALESRTNQDTDMEKKAIKDILKDVDDITIDQMKIKPTPLETGLVFTRPNIKRSESKPLKERGCECLMF